MIERARVDPHARRPSVPGSSGRGRQERTAEALADEGWQKAEVRDLNVIARLPIEFVVPGRGSRDVGHPGLEFGSLQIRPPARVIPSLSVVPTVGGTHDGVEEPAELRRWDLNLHQAKRRRGHTCRPEFRALPHLQVGSGDHNQRLRINAVAEY